MWLRLEADFDKVERMCYAGREAARGATKPEGIMDWAFGVGVVFVELDGGVGHGGVVIR